MTNKKFLSHQDVQKLASELAVKITQCGYLGKKAYPIPRGGVPVAYLLNDLVSIVNFPDDADFFIDDIIDSGSTLKRYCDDFPGKPFFALIDKTDPGCELNDKWICFPWEGSVPEGGIEDNVRRLLQYVGEDVNRGGLLETPKRVAKAWAEWTSGYKKNPADLLKVFEDGANGCDEMVIVKNIPFYTHCEHHLAPFFGTASVAYIPDGKIVGLSKLSRIVDMYARRLQVQERLTNQVADALNDNLSPKGVGVIIEARHLCMESRGLCQQGHSTVTSALRGVLKDKPEARAEFMALIK